ncbi:choice-of-anchor U domain-containing protein, partial [Undibacterium fentianense]
GTGDGNGDGIQDIEQDAVSSLIWSQQDDIDPTYLTVWNDQNLKQTQVATSQDNLPSRDDISFPFGSLALNFEGINVGASTQVSVLIHGTEPINGYWKKDVNGNLVNIAETITTSDHNTLITFTLTDGGRFDADGLANGRIVDPGAPGLITLNQLQLSQAQLAQVSPRNADT